MFFKKGQRFFAGSLGEQSDAQKIFLFGVLDRVLEQLAAKTLAPEILVNDQVLQQDYKSTLCSTDREKQIDHANDLRRTP